MKSHCILPSLEFSFSVKKFASQDRKEGQGYVDQKKCDEELLVFCPRDQRNLLVKILFACIAFEAEKNLHARKLIPPDE